MFTAYSAHARPPRTLSEDGLQALPDDVVWIDLDRPEIEEERWLEGLLGFALPTRDELKDIEPSSRLYRENGATYATATLVWRSDSETPESTDVAFILRGNLLVTIRYAEPYAFTALGQKVRTAEGATTSGAATLANLLESIVDRTAEVLEKAGVELDQLNDTVFVSPKGARSRRTTEALEAKLTGLARLQRVTAKTRESLVSLGRTIGFLMLAPEFEGDHELRDRMRSVGRDIRSLTEQATFVSGNIGFMLDAALGLINIQQNAIIKIFSIAAVVLLPPTLVGTVYGMNFDHMPELGWIYGYPFALGLMVLSALVPFLWFKRQGWL